jgi:GntR family histidine utilization transcriptional repressor
MMSLYRRIGVDIAAEISAGNWLPGHRIPYEHELMSRYGCARMTVNKALSRLVEAGLIERRKRAGSFVAVPKAHKAAIAIPDIRSEIINQGAHYHHRVLLRTDRVVTGDDTAKLMQNHGHVCEIICLHFADNRPFAVEHRLINLNLVAAAGAVDFAVEPPGSWLLGHVPWSSSKHRIGAVSVAENVAAVLEIPIGSACLSVERWTWQGTDSTSKITYVRQYYARSDQVLTADY